MWTLGFARVDPPTANDAGISSDENLPRVRDEARSIFLTLLPWGISALFHAGVVVIAFVAIWAVMHEREKDEPTAAVMSKTQAAPNLNDQPVELTNTGGSIRDVASKRPSASSATIASAEPVMTRTLGVAGGPVSTDGPSFGNSQGTGESIFGSGSGGEGEDGPLSDGYDSVVYVVDASGSLLDTFPFVIEELKEAVRGLSGDQRFTILFFRGEDEVVEVATPGEGEGLKPASDEVTAEVVRWLDPASNRIDPRGRTNPLPAIQKALGYRPEVMFLLSDNITGGGTGATQYEVQQSKLLNAITRANRSKTKINTIQFLYPDPLEKTGLEPTLKVIAEQTGGVYRFVDADDLNIAERN